MRKQVFITLFLTLCLYIQAQEEGVTLLQLGNVITTILENNQMLNYQFTLQANHSSDVTCSIETQTGFVEVYVKVCNNNNNCTITQDDIQNKENLLSDVPSKMFLQNVQTNQNKKIEFEFEAKECIQMRPKNFIIIDDTDYQCNYIVAILAPSDNIKTLTENKFTIIVKESDLRTILTENTPKYNKLISGESSHYEFFTKESDSEVYNVEFQLSTIYGFADMFVSKTEKNPDLFTADKISLLGFASYDDVTPGDNFYVTVNAITDSLYSISVKVTRLSDDKNYQKNIQYLPLTEGLWQQSTLSDTAKKAYFVIDLSNNYEYNQDNQPTINIQLQPIRGAYFDMYVVSNEFQEPTQYSQDYYSNNNSIEIKPSFHYSPIHRISVQQSEFLSTTVNGQFKISFTLAENIQEILLNQPNYVFVYANKPKKMKLEVFRGEEITITFQHFFEEVPFTLSVYLQQVPLSQEAFAMAPSRQINKQIESTTLTSEEISKECSFLHEQSNTQKCYIYLLAETKQDQNYYLLASTDNLYTLYDGLPVTVPVPTKNNPARFYYYVPLTPSPVEIFEYDSMIYTTILANIYHLQVDSNRTLWEFPNETDHQIKSDQDQTYQSNSLLIPQKILEQKDCFNNAQGCLVTLTIGLSSEQDNNFYNEDFIKNFAFTVQASSVISTGIKPGQQMISEVEQQQFKYFKLEMQTDENILVSSSALGSGQIQIYISRGHDSIPTLTNYDYKSDFYSTNEILIPKQSNNSNIGTFIIGVFAYQSCKFQLQVVTGNFKTYRIMNSYPQHAYIKKYQSGYFEYQVWWKQDFTVMISKNTGDVFMSIYKVEGDLLLANFIQNKSRYQNNYYFQSSSYPVITNKYTQTTYLKVNDGEFNCDQCTFIIEVFANEDSDFTLWIMLKGLPVYLENNKVLRNFIPKDDQQKFSYLGENSTYFIQVLNGTIDLYVNNGWEVNEYVYDVKKTLIAPINYDNSITSQDPDWTYSYGSFLIIGKQDSIYSIKAVGDVYQYKLDFGIPETIYLYKDEFREYSLNFKPEKDKAWFTLTLIIVNNLDSSTTNPYELIQYAPNVIIERRLETQNLTEKSYINAQYSSNTLKNYIIFNINDLEGQYRITINNTRQNEDPVNLRLELTANQGDLQLIVPTQETVHVTPVGSIQKFEIYQSHKAQILVEVQHCWGLVNVFATHNYNNLIQGVSELKGIKTYSDRQQILYSMEQSGVLYIGAKAISGDYINDRQSNNAVYLIKVTPYDLSDTVPLEKVVAGEAGKVEWSFQGTELIITVGKIVILEKIPEVFKFFKQSFKKLNPTSYSYWIRINSNENRDQSWCSPKKEQLLQEYTAQQHDNINNKITFKYDFSELLQKQAVYFEIAGQVEFQDNQLKVEDLLVYYNNQEISALDMRVIHFQKKHHKWGFLIVPFILIGLVLLVLYQYRRIKKLKEKLKYELEDVRNIAQLNQSQSEVEMNYNYREELNKQSSI